MKKIVTSILFVSILGMFVIPSFAQSSETDADSACREDNRIVAETLGITVEEVESAVNDGQGYAQLAASQNVEVAVLAQALLDNQTNCNREAFEVWDIQEVCMMVSSFDTSVDVDFYDWYMIAAEQLNMDVETVEFGDKSITELAAEQDVALETVTDAIVQYQSEALYQMAEADPEFADDISSRILSLNEQVSQFVQLAPNVLDYNLHTVARNAIGINASTFYAELSRGKTIQEIAEANAIPVETLSTQLRDAVQSNIEQRRALGELSDCVATLRINTLDSRITSYVNQSYPATYLYKEEYCMMYEGDSGDEAFMGDEYGDEAFDDEAFMGDEYDDEAFMGDEYDDEAFMGDEYDDEAFDDEAFMGDEYDDEAFMGDEYSDEYSDEAFMGEYSDEYGDEAFMGDFDMDFDCHYHSN